MVVSTQAEIKDWFNKTYETRGEFYLRPIVAYKIFLSILQVKLLDIACGLGRMIAVCNESNVESYGIDISDVAVSKAKLLYPKADIRVGNAEQLPYSDGQFQYITCLGSLERMLDRNKVLGEMKRVLSNDGKICLLVRNSESWFWRYVQKPLGFVNRKGHQDAMNMENWELLFEKCGFVVSKIYKDQWPLMKWKRYISLGLWNGYNNIHYGWLPVKYAYEFVFILEKSKENNP
jgi:ubiquinone/menaquinone biosynthesis C-methylase UbiE